MGSRSQPYQQHRRPQLRGNTNRACVAAMPGRFIQSFRVFCPECNQEVTATPCLLGLVLRKR